ncbi:MAG: biotin--[acetyl-CoA-carboxylase] ligase [Halobacteria archaeon]|nr:biotin--[acetyl-CoA-carboxylase] ligase [Halobacteria archaeon]
MKTTQVLDLLSEDEPVSGKEIAEEFGVSRNAVWKHIERLRDAGFEIDSDPKGYVLTSPAEYGDFGLSYYLDPGTIWEDIEYREEVPSTNSVASQLARDGAPEGTVVLADVQRQGKGRRGREWTSPSGGVWMSGVLRPEIPPRSASVITVAASVAVARGLEEAGVEPRIKWPNDVLVDGKKICGILVEIQADAESVEHAVVGIGINANVEIEDDDWNATSVKDEVGHEVNRANLAASVLEELEDLYSLASDDGDRKVVFEEWKEYSDSIGREVRVETPTETIEGEAVGVDDTGALRVETSDGERVVTAGDCEHLR